MSKERAKGREWERKVALWLTEHGVEAKRYESTCDPRGDLELELPMVVECKDVGAFSPGVWRGQAAKSVAWLQGRIAPDHYVVIAKQRGKASPADAHAIVPMPFLAELLRVWGLYAEGVIPGTMQPLTRRELNPYRVDL